MLPLRCARCRDHLDEGDLFCPNCGHETPSPEAGEIRRGPIEVHRFECSGCGATLVWETEQQALVCAFCGRACLEEKPPVRMPAPELVAPFKVDLAAAEATLRDWLGRGWLRPGDVRTGSRLTEVRGVFLPYWGFKVHCDTYWTADSNATPLGARADWAPHTGGQAQEVEVFIAASGVLTAGESEKLGPYDLTQALPYTRELIGDVPAEAFGLLRKRARLLAGGGIGDRLRKDCEDRVPGTMKRNLRLNPLYTGTTAYPVLLPVWILAYEYRGRIYRCLVNGQTGVVTGAAPVSPWKVVGTLLSPVLLILLLWLFTVLFGK